jgi:monofunctional biosynthetic peptidoglycan transglycosylase
MRRVFVGLALAAIAGFVVLLLVLSADVARYDVASLERRAPKRTALMRARAAEGRARVDQRWVSYDRISPLLRRAVLIAEDDAFFAHGGLDWHEMRESARRNWQKKRIVRGGSTITQQLARNLYLGNERTLVRKLREVLIARRLEDALSKRRIFELYLNLIEWGDGVYGAEAAARRWFGVGAHELDARQAALLASVIINPRRYSPTEPSRRIERRMSMILGRMARRGFITADELRAARGEREPEASAAEWLFGPQPPDTAESPALAPPEPEPVEADTTAADSF